MAELAIQRCDRCDVCTASGDVWDAFVGRLTLLGPWEATVQRLPAYRAWGLVAWGEQTDFSIRCVPLLVTDRQVRRVGAADAFAHTCNSILDAIEARAWDVTPEGECMQWRVPTEEARA